MKNYCFNFKIEIYKFQNYQTIILKLFEMNNILLEQGIRRIRCNQYQISRKIHNKPVRLMIEEPIPVEEVYFPIKYKLTRSNLIFSDANNMCISFRIINYGKEKGIGSFDIFGVNVDNYTDYFADFIEIPEPNNLEMYVHPSISYFR